LEIFLQIINKINFLALIKALDLPRFSHQLLAPHDLKALAAHMAHPPKSAAAF
jgi:hypothetical protein